MLEQDQREGAAWFERHGNMTGANGKWMLAHGFLAASNSYIYGPGIVPKYMKKATSGKMGVTAYFTSAMCRYMKDIGDEQVSEARKCNKDGSGMPLRANNQCEMLGRCAVHGY